MTLHTALDEAERDVIRASRAADVAYFAWKRNPNDSTWAAWGRATDREHEAEARVRDLELMMDAEGVWA